jgi:hypothetical protein
MKRTYIYVVLLTNNDGRSYVKVAMAATDTDGLEKQIAELYPDHEWIVQKDEIYPLV